MPETNTNPPGLTQTPEPKRHMKPFWPLLIIFVIASILGGLIFWFQFNLITDYELQSLVFSVQRRNGQPGKQGMAEFRSDQYDFSLKYQNTWQARIPAAASKDMGSISGSFKGGLVRVGLAMETMPNPNKLSLSTLIESKFKACNDPKLFPDPCIRSVDPEVAAGAKKTTFAGKTAYDTGYFTSSPYESMVPTIREIFIDEGSRFMLFSLSVIAPEGQDVSEETAALSEVINSLKFY